MSFVPISIVIAEDHALVREGLRGLLGAKNEFRIVGEAITGYEAVTLARTLKPDVIVMDIGMPVLNGIKAARKIRLFSPHSKILVLTAHSDDEYIEHSVSLGVSGYVMKQQSGQVLLHAIREVVSGRTYYSPVIAARIEYQQKQAEMPGGDASKHPLLTMREAEVLQLLAEGSDNEEIATALGVRVKAVKNHRQKLMDKLNIHETGGLTRYAIAEGFGMERPN